MNIRVSVAAIIVLVFLLSLVLGLVRENVLRDPISCCNEQDLKIENPCSNMLQTQVNAFYDPVTGLKTQYIVTVVFVLFTFYIYAMNGTHITFLIFLQRPPVLVLMAIVCFLCVSLFNGTSVDTFRVIDSMQSNCSKVSSDIIDAIVVYTWFNFILGVALFYAFSLTLPDYKVLGRASFQDMPGVPFATDETEDNDSDESESVYAVD